MCKFVWLGCEHGTFITESIGVAAIFTEFLNEDR